MYDYLIATDEGLAQSIPENSEKEENGGTNAKEDAELLGEDSENEKDEDSENEKDEDSEMEKDIDSEMEKDIDSEMEKDIDSEMEDDSEDFDLEDSSEPEKENEETQTDEYNVSRGIDFESFLFSPLLLLSRRGCSHQLFNACLRFALRSPHWPNGASWKSGYVSLTLFHLQARRSLSSFQRRTRTSGFWQRSRSTILRGMAIPFLSDFRSTFRRSSRLAIGRGGLVRSNR